MDRLQPEDLDGVALSLEDLLEQGADPESLRNLPEDAKRALLAHNHPEWSSLEEYLHLQEQRRARGSSRSSRSAPKPPSPAHPTTS